MDFPATFVKGDQTRVAHNPSDAVKARFDGFQLLGAGAGQVDYADLQEQAKRRGIPANQSKEALVDALRAPANQGEAAPPPARHHLGGAPPAPPKPSDLPQRPASAERDES
jgi:hypothetical protein